LPFQPDHATINLFRAMDTEQIINAIADEADDFLATAPSAKDARTVVREYLAANYPGLSENETAEVMKGLFAILNEEGFFDGDGPGEAAAWRTGEDDSIHEI